MVSEEFLNTKKHTLVSIHVLVKLEEKHVHDIKRPRETASQILIIEWLEREPLALL